MKVILTQDIPGVGKKWEVKDVKPGYGRNYLLSRNLAIPATDGNLKDIQLKQKQDVQKRAVQKDLFEKSLGSLRDFTFVIERKANEKGHLYDAVDIKEIAGLLKEKIKAEIPFEYIKLDKPIKEIGKHKVAIQKGDLETPFEIEIKPKED
jgi:large subunit ribosomal protein L9